MDRHLELEYKFDAKGVDRAKFDRALRLMKPDEEICVNVVDTYYVHNESGATIRHRAVDGKYQELTTKERRKLDSLRERTEVNVQIGVDTLVKDVDHFAYMIGYDKEIVLGKPECVVYSFNQGNEEVEVALYTVGNVVGKKITDVRTFIEVEVKGEVTIRNAIRTLDEWKDFLQVAFKLGEPLNQSLYEMYAPKYNAQGERV